MKNHIPNLLLPLFLLLLLSSCFLIPSGNKSSIEFYFFENDSFTDYITVADIDSLPLKAEPFLTQDDIVFYEWENQNIYLKDKKSDVLDSYYKGDTLLYPLKAQAFAIVVDKSPVYIGYINNFYKSLNLHNPLISEIELLLYPDDMLGFFDMSITDIPYFEDESIKSSLMDANIYHGGLEIGFDYEYGIVISDSNEVSSVEYQYKLHNLDEDDILYVDPEKVGSDNFCRLNNTPFFLGIDSTETNSRGLITYENSLDSADFAGDAIYSVISSGDSASLHVKLTGFNNFEMGGQYQFILFFASPLAYSTPEFRTRENGRIWTGWHWLPVLNFYYTGPGRNNVTSSENPDISKENKMQIMNSHYKQNLSF